MSQDSREKFGVKSQMREGGGGGDLICIFHSHGYKLMSQDSREKFGVKSQMRGGGGKEERKRERIC